MAKASKKRMSRKELREPDKFISWTHQAWVRIEPQLARIAVGAAALVIVLIGASVWSYYAGRRDEKASALFSQAVAIAQADLLPADQSLPLPDTSPSNAPRFKTVAEKYGAVVAKLDELVAHYHRSDVAREAKLVSAGALFHLGKLDEAAKDYQAYISGAGDDDPALALAHEGLGYVYEAQGKYREAMSEFDRMAPASDTAFGRDRSLFEHARMQERLGDPAGALATYRKVVALPGASQTLRQDAQDRISVLEGTAGTASAAPAPAH